MAGASLKRLQSGGFVKLQPRSSDAPPSLHDRAAGDVDKTQLVVDRRCGEGQRVRQRTFHDVDQRHLTSLVRGVVDIDHRQVVESTRRADPRYAGSPLLELRRVKEQDSPTAPGRPQRPAARSREVQAPCRLDGGPRCAAELSDPVTGVIMGADLRRPRVDRDEVGQPDPRAPDSGGQRW